jgi:hypothetical protein
MKDGAMDGMLHFDGEIERLVREGVISGAVGLLHATNPGNMRVMMADVSFDEVNSVDGLE